MNDEFIGFVIGTFTGILLAYLISQGIKDGDIRELCTEFKIESIICEKHMDKLGYK